MIQIRYGVFETNSSSTHSLTICEKDEYEDWKEGNSYLITWGYNDEYETFMPRDVAIEFLKKQAEDNIELIEYYLKKFCIDNIEDFFKNKKLVDRVLSEEFGYMSYSEYGEYTYYYSLFREDYHVENHDLVIFGYYGYDG